MEYPETSRTAQVYLVYTHILDSCQVFNYSFYFRCLRGPPLVWFSSPPSHSSSAHFLVANTSHPQSPFNPHYETTFAEFQKEEETGQPPPYPEAVLVMDVVGSNHIHHHQGWPLPALKCATFQKTEPSSSFSSNTASGSSDHPQICSVTSFQNSQTFCDTESKVYLLPEKVSVFQAADEPGRLLRNNSFPPRPCHRRTPGINSFQKGNHIIGES